MFKGFPRERKSAAPNIAAVLQIVCVVAKNFGETPPIDFSRVPTARIKSDFEILNLEFYIKRVKIQFTK